MPVLLKCPDCDKKFKWTFNEESRWPDHCPLCGRYMGVSHVPDDEVVMPFLQSAKTRATDKVARDIMDGSEKRAEIAAAQAGCSVEEMSSLKITNLNDRKDTETAAMPVQNVVTQQMDSMNQRGGQFGFSGSAGAEWAAGVADGSVTIDGKVTKGIAPRAGANVLGRIQQAHGRG